MLAPRASVIFLIVWKDGRLVNPDSILVKVFNEMPADLANLS